ncbi:MAG: hypothetical protein WC856_26125 [Methylococcaceae bacterium]|jgi:hypothetical protein
MVIDETEMFHLLARVLLAAGEISPLEIKERNWAPAKAVDSQ